jgi:hypothetical protein
MHRLLCWAIAVELNATAAATAIGSSELCVGWSAMEQSTTDIEIAAQPRTMERACLAFIESSAQGRYLDPEHPRLGRSSPGADVGMDRLTAV